MRVEELEHKPCPRTKATMCECAGVNSLQDRLRKKAERKKYESRILYSLLISAVTILFFVST